MKRITATWKYVFLLIMMVSAVCLFGNSQKVSAASYSDTTCRVIFTNAKGQTYHSLTKAVEKGTVIQLPDMNKEGYKTVWVTKFQGKEYKYSAGRNVTINQTTKFYLKLYKEYTVRFYTANGRNEYTGLRQTVVSGGSIKMPVGNSNASYTFSGWAAKKGGSVSKKSGATVKVKKNLKFYAVQKKVDTTGIKLYKYDGSYWKTIKNTNGKTTFPAVDLGSGNMVLGWSRTQGKNAQSTSDYKPGDRIPSKNGRYYMVVFGMSMDREPATITTPTKFEKVYCVGDSRTVDTKRALGASAPANVEFIAESGQGLSWFKSTGYKQLLRSVARQPKNEKKAVIINLGVNDLKNVNAYVPYMKKVAANLKKYNCKMYYLSVNPVNSAMIRNSVAKNRSEAQITSFNRTIYRKLCSGSNRTFTYINSCTNLQMKGWISNRFDMGIYDGLHYSDATYLRIFDYCMRYLNR